METNAETGNYTNKTKTRQTSLPMRRIKELPSHLIDQIKAGEVIERPASIIKELIENSIDASATRISIHIRGNGLDLISVEDNGRGIAFEDLPHAMLRHTTSKIDSFEDIYKLRTYGFRGEALASIAAVSRIECISYPEENPGMGGKIRTAGGIQEELSPLIGKHSGTYMYVRDLFYNTPVRLRFLKSKGAEKKAIKKIILSFIITNPHIHFEIKWDDGDKEIFATSSGENVKHRVGQVFFKKKNSNKVILDFCQEYEGYRVSGFVSASCSKGHGGKICYLFVNKRLFFDRQIHALIHKKMEILWQVGNFGHYVINIHVPQGDIDVNVHPGKTQVHFFQAAKVFALISSSIEHMLSTHSHDIQKTKRTLESPASFTTGEVADLMTTGKMAGENKNEEFHLAKLSPHYYAYICKETSALIDASKTLGLFLSSSIRNYKGESTPLLVGEPFEDKKLGSPHFEFFASLGFEFTRVDQKTIALRAIPKWCEGLDISLIAKPLISFACTNNNFCELAAYLKEYDFENISAPTLKQVVCDVGTEVLEDRKYLLPLSDQNISSIFA